MLPQSEGKIFLAGERGHAEQDWFRSYHTFNFGVYQQAHKAPFGPLYVLNDDTLAGRRSIIEFMEHHSDVILIPTVGTVDYTDSAGHKTVVDAGQVQRHTLLKGTTFEISNPYENELINFIQIWIRRNEATTFSKPHVFSFDLKETPNSLIPIIPDIKENGIAPTFFMGRFAGREETVYQVSNPQNGVFVFVLQGAFEVQYRLLETRDGLALWGVPQLDIEALSNDAILLLMEVPLA